MAMAVVDDPLSELDLSGYSIATTTTTTMEDDHVCNWNTWSPLLDWDSLAGGHDDFRNLIESMVDENAVLHHQPAAGALHIESVSGLSEDTVMEEDGEIGGSSNDFKGVRLVHLLTAAAEAMARENKCRDLARVILVRLKDLASPIEGTNMERLAAHFTQALQRLLEGAGGVQNEHTSINGPHHPGDHHLMNVLAAFELFHDMSPYVKFGHFTANQAILEAVAHDRRVHIVDYDIMEGIQWASLMQAFVSRKDGTPAPHLRITAISRGSGSYRRSMGTVQETGRRLTAFAESIGQPFSFHQCRLDSDKKFRPSNLKLVRGEALVFNCMLHLPHFSCGAPESVASFLSGSKTLNPRLVTLVEEEVGATREGGFVGRFMDLLHHYLAMYDSLEAGFPMQGRARELVERVFLGPRISGSLARIYRAHGEEENYSWGGMVGCGGVPSR